MTPKEKANELHRYFYTRIPGDNAWELAKQFATKCVDEMQVINVSYGDVERQLKHVAYYEKVRIEIEKL